ncbi:MAG: C-GCAxxG-C-C family protein [Candidatus Marinimicrobia bacterium]|nr:C-GCAxxG-C-C family protein [Candidatus Neomarinimicrobiota bacterium]
METVKKKLNPRKTFWKYGACSHAMYHLLNHEFGNEKPQEEKASDMLAGGIAQKGHQCGMLWGGSLAIGTEAYRKYENKNMAIASAINVSKQLVDSFYKRTKTVNCKDISRVDWENKFQLIIYMLKTIAQGFVFSPCFNLIVKWTPEAIQAANDGLNEHINFNQPCISCSTEVVKIMGGTEEESIMVAGFAGGIGLSGNACGALGAAIWYKMLEWTKNNPDKSASMFNNPDANKVLRTFYTQTDSEMLCHKICNRSFSTIDEHSDYIKSGGCSKIIEALSKS